jgi:type I restriction-modification system DNA methylase subunit
MRCGVMAHRIAGEVDVEDRIKGVLERFVGQRFNDVTITAVKRQYDVDGRRADIAVLKDDGLPILLIETKKKYERGGWRVERRFIPTSEEVVGQAVAYAAILKRKGIYVPFVATANESQLTLFKIPENIEQLVDWRAVEERDYGRVLENFYEFRHSNLVFHRPHRFSEDFFKELLETVTGVYARRFGVEERRQEIHWALIEDFRGFVDFLAPFIQEAIAPGGRFRDDIAGLVEEHSGRTGYTPAPEGLAREMAYVLLNEIVFYKVLERYYKLPRLEPLYERGLARTCHAYLTRLRGLFDKAMEVSRDFETIFRTGAYDAVDVTESEEILKTLDWLVRLIDHYKVEKLGDIIGFIYEDLIPGEERHRLGQFYTPRPIAELIVKWAVGSPDDKVLDLGCGSGTFLVEAYKRLAELKLKKPFKDIKHVPGDVHKQILGQLYAIDINEFPAHLTATNLAMKNVRVPSPETNIFVRDYFTVIPNHKLIAPYRVRTPEGEREVEVVFKDFDAVVGNPPYTRWIEIPEEIRERILSLYGEVMKSYGLYKSVTGGALPGIYVPWVIHSTNLLKEGGRLGMIISDAWLETEYGVGFVRYLIDNYKIVAIIDIATRVFETPLIGACIILLEKSSRKDERDANNVVLLYLKKQYDVDTILKIVEDAGRGVIKPYEGIIINIIRQADIYKRLREGVKPIDLFFDIESTINAMALTGKLVKLGDIFQPSEGNAGWSVYASIRGRGAGVGGEEFYYLDESKVEQFNLSKYIGTYLKPLISTPRRLKFFAFTKEDWEKEYMFIANAPLSQLPPEVQKYIKLGETSITITKGPNKGKPVSESPVAKTRKKLGKINILGRTIAFYDWYDLGGVVESPMYVARGTRYWVRFVLARFQCALDDRILALIPRQGVQFDEVELKALLAHLNSSFTQLQAEAMGRVAGGVALLELDVRPLSSFLVLDVRRLPRGDVEKLAQLFDKLESEARRLGGADSAENVYGSELAGELTGRTDVRPGIQGLFNTVIREVDYEVARMLGLESLVEPVRALVLAMAGRRLARAQEARREAIVGEEREVELRGRRARRRAGGEGGSRVVRRLNEFLQGS